MLTVRTIQPTMIAISQLRRAPSIIAMRILVWGER
jgi:hypothetical protein